MGLSNPLGSSATRLDGGSGRDDIKLCDGSTGNLEEQARRAVLVHWTEQLLQF